jgi:hypothetical protein
MFLLKRFPRRSCQTGAHCALGRDLRDLQGGCKEESRVAGIILADISQFIRVSLGDRAVALPLFCLFSVDVVIDIPCWPIIRHELVFYRSVSRSGIELFYCLFYMSLDHCSVQNIGHNLAILVAQGFR